MKTRWWQFFLPLLILWLAFGLRLYRLDFQSIWWDEGHSIFVAKHPLPQIPTIPAMDVHPPAYFALLHEWMNIAGLSEFGLRFLSVLCSMLTVGLLWRFGSSITRQTNSTSRFAPVYTALLATLSPLYVAYAQEVRGYAMITFLALLSTYFLWRIVFLFPTAANRQWSAVSLYILSTTACLYTHYFTIFLLLFQNLVWLIWIWRSNDRQTGIGHRFALWLGSQIGIVLLFTPQLWLALRQVTGYTNPNLTPPALPHFISRSWQAYTVGLTIDPAPARWGMWLTGGVLAITWFAIITEISRRKIQNSILIIQNFLFLLAWFLIPLAAYFILLQRQPSFEPRYMILVTPALFLLLALGINYVSRFTFNVLGYLLYTLPIIIFIIGLHSYYTNETYFKDDSAGVAEWLATETTANDIVYIDVPHPFHYYAEQRAIAAPTRYLFVDIHTAADILTKEATGRDRLYWVAWRGSDTDPRGVIPFLAEKFGQQLGQLDFRGYRVTWFSLPDACTGFSLPTTLGPTQATYGDVLRLDGAAYGGTPPETTTATAGESAWATLHFTLLRDTDTDYRVSVRLQGEDSQVISQIDKDLLNDRHFRTSAWPLNDPALNQAINVYTLAIPPETPPGIYRLEVVVYKAQPPYPSEGVTGPETSDGAAAIIGHISVTP